MAVQSRPPSVPDSAAAAPPLSLYGVTAGYRLPGGDVTALRGVDFSLAAGELLGLIGPNGCGKTTLIRVAAGVLRPLAGSVRLFGQDVTGLGQRGTARLVGVVPQDPVLPEGFTAEECVLMGRTPHLRLLEAEGPSDREAARRAMLRTNTWEFASRPVGKLSGGERQRVVIARALAQETPVLLLDEPTAHLDIGHQAGVLRLVRALCRDEGKSVVAVAHDLTLAAQFCDRLVLMQRGAVAAEGAPSAVLRREVLERVYGAGVTVFPHPESGRPVVAPSPEPG